MSRKLFLRDAGVSSLAVHLHLRLCATCKARSARDRNQTTAQGLKMQPICAGSGARAAISAFKMVQFLG